MLNGCRSPCCRRPGSPGARPRRGRRPPRSRRRVRARSHRSHRPRGSPPAPRGPAARCPAAAHAPAARMIARKPRELLRRHPESSPRSAQASPRVGSPSDRSTRYGAPSCSPTSRMSATGYPSSSIRRCVSSSTGDLVAEPSGTSPGRGRPPPRIAGRRRARTSRPPAPAASSRPSPSGPSSPALGRACSGQSRVVRTARWSDARSVGAPCHDAGRWSRRLTVFPQLVTRHCTVCPSRRPHDRLTSATPRR